MNRLQRALDIIFPEVNNTCMDRYSKAYLQFLAAYSSASSITNEDIRNLRKSHDTEGRGRQCMVTAEEIKDLAKHSVGEDNIAVELEVKSLIAFSIPTKSRSIIWKRK